PSIPSASTVRPSRGGDKGSGCLGAGPNGSISLKYVAGASSDRGGFDMEAGSRRSQSWKVACALLALVAAAGVLGGATPAGAHSGDVIDSLWASSPPTVDGTMTPGEWAGAMAVDLGAIPGNSLASSLLVMNDATYLWFAYDPDGDRTASVNDSASFAFDTGHDAVGTNGAEDQFIVS